MTEILSCRSPGSENSRGKRKRSPAREMHSPSNRPRLDEYNSWHEHGFNEHAGGGTNGSHPGNFPSQSEDPDAPQRPSQRLSNLRTSMESTASASNNFSHPYPHHPSLTSERQGLSLTTTSQPPSAHDQAEYNRLYPSPPQICLDLNSPNREISGLPFSGYDFLGDDLFALLGNVIRPSSDAASQYEQHTQVVWQAYNGQNDVAFGG